MMIYFHADNLSITNFFNLLIFLYIALELLWSSLLSLLISLSIVTLKFLSLFSHVFHNFLLRFSITKQYFSFIAIARARVTKRFINAMAFEIHCRNLITYRFPCYRLLLHQFPVIHYSTHRLDTLNSLTNRPYILHVNRRYLLSSKVQGLYYTLHSLNENLGVR